MQPGQTNRFPFNPLLALTLLLLIPAPGFTAAPAQRVPTAFGDDAPQPRLNWGDGEGASSRDARSPDLPTTRQNVVATRLGYT